MTAHCNNGVRRLRFVVREQNVPMRVQDVERLDEVIRVTVYEHHTKIVECSLKDLKLKLSI